MMDAVRRIQAAVAMADIILIRARAALAVLAVAVLIAGTLITIRRCLK